MPDPWSMALEAVQAAFGEPIRYTGAGLSAAEIVAIKCEMPADQYQGINGKGRRVAFEVPVASLPGTPRKSDTLAHDGMTWKVIDTDLREDVRAWFLFVERGTAVAINLLVGRIDGTGVMAGGITAASRLSGNIAGAAVPAGVLSTATTLVGAISGAGQSTGIIGVTAYLAGGVVGAGGLAGTISATTTLAGSVAGAGILTGTIGSAAMLSGPVAGNGAPTGVLSVTVALSGAVAGSGALAGSLSTGSSEDASTTAYANAMTVQPTAQRRGLINDLIAGLRADGVLAKLDWLTLLAAHDAQAGRLNVIAPAKSLAAVNSPTFTVDRGYTGDASAAHLSFGEAFNASGNQFALNSATFGAWCNQMAAFSGARPHIGSSQSTRTFLSPANSGNPAFRANDNASTTFDATTRLGSHTATRADAATKKIYRNGSLLATASTTGVAVATGPAYLMRNGVEYADDRLAAAWFGAALTDGEAVALQTRLNTYLTAIGAA